MLRKFFVILVLALAASSLFAGGTADEPESLLSVAVFVPGMLEGSPTYEEMDRGVRRAAAEVGARVTTVEGGFNQGEWKNQIVALAAEGSFTLIVTSNPALTEICAEAKSLFPAQTFLVLDGSDQGADELVVYRYNHREQAFLAGALAAHAVLDGLTGNPQGRRLGLIAGQTYPDMEKSIVPGYEMGMKSVDPAFSLDFRVVGNWYDAAKAAELADAMYSSGVEVILPIAGGANQGVVSTARKSEKKVVWFDSPGTDQAPGIILGSVVVQQEEAAYEAVKEIVAGSLTDGDLREGNAENGFVLIDTSEEAYEKHLPPSLRETLENLTAQFAQGRYALDY